MSVTPRPKFSYLRSKIREWKAGDLLRPCDQSREQFWLMAPIHLTQILEELQQALEAEGIRATVQVWSEDARQMSLSIDEYDLELSFGPDGNPHAFQVRVCQRATQENEYSKLIPYRQLRHDLDRVLELIEDAVLCVLGPRRASQDPEIS